MSHTGKRVSNVYYLDNSQSSESAPPSHATGVQKPETAQSNASPDYDQLVDSMQLLRNELRAAEASLGLFQQEIEQSIGNCLQMDFPIEQKSGK